MVKHPGLNWYYPQKQKPSFLDIMAKTKTKTKGAGKRKCKGGSLRSIWDKLIHPIDNWRESRAEAEEEDMGYDLLDGLTEDDIEDLLRGIKRKSKRRTPAPKKVSNEKGPTDKELAELLAALSSGVKEPKPAGLIYPPPPPER